MKFNYSKENLKGFSHVLQRGLEILPGATSWIILLGMIYLSTQKPTIAAVIIIAFYLYWLLKLIYMTIFLSLSYYRLRLEQNTDWMKRVKGIDNLSDYLNNVKKNTDRLTWGQKILRSIHIKELDALKNSKQLPISSDQIYQLVIFPVVKESQEILEPGIKNLSEQHFPRERMLIIYALEERAETNIKEGVFALQKKYKNAFLDVLTIVHPNGIPGEARVKGANATFAAKEAARIFTEKKIPYENIIVSCFDADTVVSPHYFSCLSYYFMISPNRLQSSFQPIPVYHNNIWDVPGFARVIETGSSFFQLIEATNPEKLVTFSSHSMSFQALVDAGYWPVDMISDDSAIFWKCFIHFDGKYDVVPMYVTLSMDIAGSPNLWETARTVYKQKRRWAWGVENFPLVIRAFIKSNKISLMKRIQYGFKLLEGHVSWATWGFLLSFIGWLPGILAQQQYESTVLYYNAPRIAATIFRLATISLIISIIISLMLLPRKKQIISLRKKILHAVEWLLIPFILVLFSALPALDAQTRLMLGKYMEFWVTDKKRRNIQVK